MMQGQGSTTVVMARMDSLPSEIIFQICCFLEPHDIVRLQHVNTRLLVLGRDEALWREQCFNKSSFIESIRRRQALLASEPTQEPRFRNLARALATGNGLGDSRLTQPREEARDFKEQSNERIRIMANWDPSYPGEKVQWYDEYVARHAPISTSWLQQPRHRESAEHEYMEVRGMGLYTMRGETDATLVVAPLDDGSVCLWDISRASDRRGAIVGRSKSGILSVDDAPQVGPMQRSKMINTGVTECVSVDSGLQRAYFAVQSGLVEVDLETLSTISHSRFPFSITALSEAKHPTPLTVGTNLSLEIHDPRIQRYAEAASYEKLEGSASKPTDFRSLLNPEPSSLYAHLYHPGPLSILHLPSSGSEWDGNGDIYVAGRFPSILNYDRRYFPRLRGTIHSGARLSCMASISHPFASLEKDLARRGELTMGQVLAAKTRPGKTLIACGEYNTKGSLEMYGLSPDPLLSTISSDSSAGSLQNSVMKNRQTSSSSKLLAVSNHGTRIVVSDGSGNLKWFERDGFTEARRWNIAHGSVEAPQGIFGMLGDAYMDSGSGDIVIKLANTHNGRTEQCVNEDDLLMWTGEKIGILGFSNKPGFTADGFEDTGNKSAEQMRKEMEEHTYAQTMRRALQANADEVRYMRGLGLGSGEI